MRRLEQDETIQGHALRAGTEVRLDDAGRLAEAILEEPHTLGGLRCRGSRPPPTPDGGWAFYVRDSVRFFSSGAIANAWLVGEQTIGGVRVRGGPVSFFEDGSLESFALAGDTTFGGVAFRAGTRLQLGADRAPVLASHLPEDLVVEGVACSASGDVGFHPNGRLESFTLARGATVRGVELPAGTHVALDAAGESLDFFSPAPVVHGGATAPADQWVRVDRTGAFDESPFARVGLEPEDEARGPS